MLLKLALMMRKIMLQLFQFKGKKKMMKKIPSPEMKNKISLPLKRQSQLKIPNNKYETLIIPLVKKEISKNKRKRNKQTTQVMKNVNYKNQKCTKKWGFSIE